MPDSILGAGYTKINQTGQFPALSESTLWQQETYYKESKRATMGRDWADGSLKIWWSGSWIRHISSWDKKVRKDHPPAQNK